MHLRFALFVIDMQKVFRPSDTNSSIVSTQAMIEQVQMTVAAFRDLPDARIVVTQHGYLNGSDCDGHLEYRRHWQARGFGEDCRDFTVTAPGFALIDEISGTADLHIRKEVSM